MYRGFFFLLVIQAVAAEAENIFENAVKLCEDLDLDTEEIPGIPEDKVSLIWFLQPKTALYHLRAPSMKYFSPSKQKLPFLVRRNSLVHAKELFLEAMKSMGVSTGKKVNFFIQLTIIFQI